MFSKILWMAILKASGVYETRSSTTFCQSLTSRKVFYFFQPFLKLCDKDTCLKMMHDIDFFGDGLRFICYIFRLYK